MNELQKTAIACLISAIVSGGVSTWGTVSALNVHIEYIKEAVKQNSRDIAVINNHLYMEERGRG